MPAYVLSPFKPTPPLAVAGTPNYLIGSYNDKTGPTLGNVISNSAVTTTATLTFQIISGNIPAVGALITVVGCANSANFNVTNVAIASVSTTAAGVCTVTYTISSTSQGTTNDGGQVIIPQPEVGETISGAYKSIPIARPYNNPNVQEGQSLTATLNLGSGLSAVTCSLQGADFDVDSEYTDVHVFGTSGLQVFQSGQDTIAQSATPGVVTANPGGVNIVDWRFYRFKITSVTGSGAVIGKIEF